MQQAAARCCGLGMSYWKCSECGWWWGDNDTEVNKGWFEMKQWRVGVRGIKKIKGPKRERERNDKV